MNREEELLHQTLDNCKAKFKAPETSAAEKKAMAFYIEQLSEMGFCSDNAKFARPGKGVGGTGDEMVFHRLVVRDEQGTPVISPEGELLTEICAFEDFATYLKYVDGKKVEPGPGIFYNGIPQDDYVSRVLMQQRRMSRYYR